MKNFKIKIFTACILVVLSFTPNQVNSAEITDIGEVSPMFSYINVFQSTFDISDSGKTSNTVYLDARNVDKVEVEAHLQQYKGGSWNTIKYWSSFNNGTSCGLSKDLYVISGYSYRLVTYGYVYQGSNLVESTTDISSMIYY